MSDEISENPLCTKCVRPGAIPFLFPTGQDVETLVRRLQRNGWWGEIVGRHGTGKSALLATLIPQIELAGQRAVLVELHDGQRRLPLDLNRDSRLRAGLQISPLSLWERVRAGSEGKVGIPLSSPSPPAPLPKGERSLSGHALWPPLVLIVDGYEQLSRWRRLLLKRHCRRRGLGLLVTAHASVGLPELYRTAATPELAEKIVVQLMAGRSPALTSSEITACFARHNGDVRETLFDLYDLYERRRST